MTPATFAVRLIENALGELAERVEQLSDGEFLAAHQLIHDEPRSAVTDLVAAVHEREFWRRWPEGRPDDV